MQNLSLKGKQQQKTREVVHWRLWEKFKRLYFYVKSKIKNTKYHTIKVDTSLKSYDNAEYNILDWEQFW